MYKNNKQMTDEPALTKMLMLRTEMLLLANHIKSAYIAKRAAARAFIAKAKADLRTMPMDEERMLQELRDINGVLKGYDTFVALAEENVANLTKANPKFFTDENCKGIVASMQSQISNLTETRLQQQQKKECCKQTNASDLNKRKIKTFHFKSINAYTKRFYLL